MANFASYSNALELFTMIANKLKSLKGAYQFKGSVSFASLPIELNRDMVGYVYNVTDAFTTDSRFVEGSGKEFSAGTDVAVADVSAVSYQAVTPAGNENPAEEGWYEESSGSYTVTQDTEIQAGKTYYQQVITLVYKFDVLSSFVDVSGILSDIDSVAAMITSSVFNSANSYSIGDVVRYNKHLYRFKASHSANTDWDSSEVDLITVEGDIGNRYTKSEVDTLLSAKADKSNTKTAWKGTAAQYAALQTDDYDLYFVEEAVS